MCLRVYKAYGMRIYVGGGEEGAQADEVQKA